MDGHYEREALRNPGESPERNAAGLDDADRLTLQQLDDTRFLAVGRLDVPCCERLARRGLAASESGGYWKITPAGRRVINAAH